MKNETEKGYGEYFRKIQSGDLSVNPYLQFFNVKIGTVTNGKAVLEMNTDSRMYQGAGIVQGGIIAALSDEAMAHALLSELDEDEITATVDIHHSHLRPVKEGLITATGEIVKHGRKIAFMKGEVIYNDKVVLTSTATFIIQKTASE